jgi:sugar diacid utilization regulator
MSSASNADNAQCTGISLPIVAADAIVGAVMLDDSSPRGKAIAVIAKTLAELLIRQMSVIDPFAQQRWARDQFISDLLYRRLDCAADGMMQVAASLGIDLSIPRVVVVVDVKPAIALRTVSDSTNAALSLITHMLQVERSQLDLVAQARRAIVGSDGDLYSFLGERWLVLLAVVDRTIIRGSQQPLDHGVQCFLDELARAWGMITSAGIGHVYPNSSALAQSFVDARFTLETGTRVHGAGHVFRVDTLGLAGFVGGDDWRTKDELTQRLNSWGPGKFDAELFLDGKGLRPDGKTAATLIPPAFGLAGVNLHTWTGWGSVTHWNAFVANIEMHGKGTFYDPRLNNAERFPVAARAGSAISAAIRT